MMTLVGLVVVALLAYKAIQVRRCVELLEQIERNTRK